MDAQYSNIPFEPIHLSRSDKKELQGIAKTVLDANLGRFVHFSGADQNEWTPVKVQDQLRVYSSRDRTRRRRYPFRSDRGDEDLQSILCVGSIPGTLDNLLHTFLGRSNEATNPSDMTDFSGAAVLSSIKEPTLGNPFEAQVVKWAELDVRRRSMGLVKNRDYVYVEATGIKYLATGERLGYHVMHSVDIPGADELPGRARAMLSACFFFHEVNNRLVSVYTTAMMDPMTDRVRRVIVPRFTNMLLWRLTSVEDVNTRNTLGKSYSELSNLKPSHNCATCSKRVWRIGIFSGRYATCVVCCRYVCRACKIEKKLKQTDQKETKRKVNFCFSCLTDVMWSTNESEFSFASDTSGSTRPAFHSVWASRIPGWGSADTGELSEGSIDFSSTR